MTDPKPLTTSTDSHRRADERLREEANLPLEPAPLAKAHANADAIARMNLEAAQRAPTHNHAMGRDCCPHPDCVSSEERKLNRSIILSRARKLADGSRDGIADSRAREGLELADLVLKYL